MFQLIGWLRGRKIWRVRGLPCSGFLFFVPCLPIFLPFFLRTPWEFLFILFFLFLFFCFPSSPPPLAGRGRGSSTMQYYPCPAFSLARLRFFHFFSVVFVLLHGGELFVFVFVLVLVLFSPLSFFPHLAVVCALARGNQTTDLSRPNQTKSELSRAESVIPSSKDLYTVVWKS